MGNTLNKNSNRWEGNVYIYIGGDVHGGDKEKIEHVRVHGSVPVIHEKAFRVCFHLQTIEFAKNQNNNMIKEIGNGSFMQCFNLSSINLQDTQVETIGDRTFFSCKHLTAVQFPPTIRQIGRSCFAHCHQLTNLDLSHVNDLETIEEYAYFSCKKLATINLPTTTSRIGKGSFCSCTALEVVDLRTTCVTEMGRMAFFGCINLSTIYFPRATKSIGTNCFAECMKLTSINLQATSVETIGEGAFAYCSNLTKINLPKTVTNIGYGCFVGCSKLERINLHETSIEKIGKGAFRNCTNLTMIVGRSTPHHQEEQEEEEELHHQENIIDDDETLRYYDYMELPASLVEVGPVSFDNCPMLQNIFDTNRMHYLCDLNRGGRQFLQRHHHEDNIGDDNSTGDAKKRHGKVYYGSLWPLILYRVMNEMNLPRHRICGPDDTTTSNLTLYTDADPFRRRGSVVFYLLVHGVVADLQTTTNSI